MTRIKAIETVYNGYRFRSRLEARWAVFFDTLGVNYEYEQEGYNLGNGVRYLPDFYFPEWDKYIEVKPWSKMQPDELHKCGLLVQRSEKTVMLLRGNPWPGRYHIVPIFPSYTSDNDKCLCAFAHNEWDMCCFAFGEGDQLVYLTLTGADATRKMEMPPLKNILPMCCPWQVYDGSLMWILESQWIEQGNEPPMWKGLHIILGTPDDMKEAVFSLSRAFIAARQARFEFGENGT
jgi:hypothetical protein